MKKIYNFFFKKIEERKTYLYSLFFGFVLVLCLPPYNFWPLIFPSITFLFLKSYLASSSKESFFVGWFFGISFFIFGLYWIFNSFLIRADIYFYLIPICLFLLSAFLSIFIGIVCFLNYKFKTKSIIPSIIFFSIFWTFIELLRGSIITGFPWNLIAHVWVEFESILQICSILGVYGLTFLTVIFVLSSSIFFLQRNFLINKNFFFFLSIFIFTFLILIFGNNRLNKSIVKNYDSQIFRIVQPNINQKDKLNSYNLEKNYKKIFDLSFSNKMGSLNASEKLIILWPETAITNLNFISSLPTFEKIKSKLKDGEYIITGSFKEQSNGNEYYNSILVIDKKLSNFFVYDKIHLVPFGEYIPFEKILNKFGFNFISLKSGNSVNKIVDFKDIPKFKPLICYEIIFPGKYSNSKNEAKFILNLTNDAWFGNTSGPYQHFIHSIFRAIEEGKHFIRVANTGISASVDPFGRILNKIDLNSSGFFDTQLVFGELNNNVLTTTYSKFGNKLIFFILIILFCIVYFLEYKLTKKGRLLL